LAGDKGKEVWEKLIKEVDTNGDGVIDYNEFIQLMTRL
jgi:Ca2+-binding EF-hand superfamily protein